MAIVAAAVVVANPVPSPPADVAIPSVQLSSGNGLPVDMLDRAFLDAIAPAPPESTSPIDVLRQLLAALAADAGQVGREAIAQAFAAGAAAMAQPAAQPALTAASDPYPVIPDPAFIPLAGPALILLPTSLPQAVIDVAPALHAVLSNVRDDVGYVGGRVVEAAFAVGAVVAGEPRLIATTLAALATGDVRAALANAVQAVAAPLGPPLIVFNALREVAEKRLSELHDYVERAQAGAVEAAVPDLAVDVPPSLPRTPAQQQPAPDQSSVRRLSVRPQVSAPRPAGAVAEPESDFGATHLTIGNKAVPRVGIPAPGGRHQHGSAAVGQVRTSVQRFGDTVRSAVKTSTGTEDTARPAGQAG